MLTERAQELAPMRNALLEEFGGLEEPKDIIHAATAARVHPDGLLNSLRRMEPLFEKTDFNQEAKFGVLRNAAMLIPELSQLAVYRECNRHRNLEEGCAGFPCRLLAFGHPSISEYAPRKFIEM